MFLAELHADLQAGGVPAGREQRAGRTLISKQVEFLQDVSDEPYSRFLRRDLAIRAGFRSSLSIPILFLNSMVRARYINRVVQSHNIPPDPLLTPS
eukprot:337542-Prorocentrum_minimum.AAC.1